MINKKEFLEAVAIGDGILQEAKLNRAKVEMSITSLSDALKDYTKGVVSCSIICVGGETVPDKHCGGEVFHLRFKRGKNDVYKFANMATIEVLDKSWGEVTITFRDRSTHVCDGYIDSILLKMMTLPSTINTINYLVDFER